jgi:hypothetical protein
MSSDLTDDLTALTDARLISKTVWWDESNDEVRPLAGDSLTIASRLHAEVERRFGTGSVERLAVWRRSNRPHAVHWAINRSAEVLAILRSG